MADFENFAQSIAKYNLALPTLSDGQASELQVDANGRLRVQADVTVELSAADGDSVLISDGTDSLAVNGDGSINAVVSATNLDIRDLVFATDKVDVSGSSVSISGTVGVTQSTSPWVVSNGGTFAVQESGAALTALQLIDNLVLLDGSVWSAGSSGAELLAVRKDASGPLTGVADGDLSPLQVNANGELKVSASLSASDVEADVSSDPTGDGLIPLTAGPDILVSKAVGAGTNLRIYGWSWAADRTCAIRLEVYDLAVLVEILRVTVNSGSMPGNEMNFGKPIEIAGAADRVVRVAATKVAGQTAGGFGSAGLNCATF